MHVCPHIVLIVDNWSQACTAVNPKTITAKHCSISQEQFFALFFNCLTLKKEATSHHGVTQMHIWSIMVLHEQHRSAPRHEKPSSQNSCSMKYSFTCWEKQETLFTFNYYNGIRLDDDIKFDHLEAKFNVNKSATSEIYHYNSSSKHFAMVFPPVYIKWVMCYRLVISQRYQQFLKTKLISWHGHQLS